MTAYLEPAAPKRTKKAQKSKSIPDENINPLETKRMRGGRKIIRVVKRGSFQKKMADLYPGIKKEIKTRKKETKMKLSAGRIEEDQTGAMDNDGAGGGNSFLGFP
jgi:hypothetical protein